MPVSTPASPASWPAGSSLASSGVDRDAASPSPAHDAPLDAFTTLRDLLRWTLTQLARSGASLGQGTDDLFDEAAWLVLGAFGLPPDRLEPLLDARTLRSEREAFFALLERRCVERVPTAYLLGEAWLHGVRFRSDARALVPRSLIADLLVGQAAGALGAWLRDEDAVADVLDLCTGGGSLAVLAAHRFPQARIVAADISADALALAADNVALHGLGERIELVRSDLFDALAGRRFDLILTNPPYVSDGSMRALPPEFLAEPHAALAGGADGMHLVRPIAAQAAAHLRDQGVLVVEIGHEAAHFEAAFSHLQYAWLPVPAGDRMVALLTREQLLRA